MLNTATIRVIFRLYKELLVRYTYRTEYVFKAWCLCFLVFLSAFMTVKAQDAVFSQYYASSLYLNPAFAGAEPTTCVSLNSRVQWKSVVTPYTTSQASLIVPIYRSSDRFNSAGGIGLSVYNNKAGQVGLNATGINLNAAYVIQLNDHNHILTGVQVGFIQKTIDFSQTQWGSQYNSLNGFDSSIDPGEYNFISSVLTPDVGAGLLYYNNPRRDITELGKSFYFGYSVYHINRGNESVIKDIHSALPMLHKITAGGEYSLSSSWNISPNVLVAMQNASMQINLGAYATYSFGDPESTTWIIPNKLTGGGWYRLNDAIIASLGIGNKFYMIGFSYDLNSSSLRTNSGGRGAYEISLKISSPKIVKTQRVYQTPRI